VRGVLGAAPLRRDRPARIVADKDVEAIAIEGQGQAVVRPWRPRRCRLAGSPGVRRRRRPEDRQSQRPLTSCSFSVAWQSLKPA
jgi:hypothetical protein